MPRVKVILNVFIETHLSFIGIEWALTHFMRVLKPTVSYRVFGFCLPDWGVCQKSTLRRTLN